jgi:hypothetical protein
MRECRVKAVIRQHYKYIALILIVSIFQWRSFSTNLEQMRNKSLFIDADGYWHLLRAQEIHDTGNWDNEINFRGNAPFGERIHWTHAMDIVLLGGAYLGSLFTDFETSLYWFGVLVGPLFFLLSLVVIIAFGRCILGVKHGVYLALLFAVNSSHVFVLFSMNRPDHHCLVGFAYILYFYSFILLLNRPKASLLAALTGIVGAVGLWSGLELLILLGLSVLYLGIVWVVNGDKYLNANFILTLALSICIAITLLMDEKASNYCRVAYDKRSIVHVTLFASVALYWLAVIVLGRFGVGKGINARLAMAGGGCVLLLSILLSLFPDILKGPMANVDPRLYAVYLEKTGEFGLFTTAILHSLLLVGPGLIYLVCTVHKAERGRRIVLSWLILAICVYSAMALTMNRWVYTLGLISLLPNASILIAISRWENTVRNAVLSLSITVILVLVPFWLPNALSSKRIADHEEYDYKVVDVLSFLESQDNTSEREIVLANILIGPAIMYHTSFNVVGTANHNNARGILDTYYILNAEDDSAAKAIIDVRGIDYILVDYTLRMFAGFKLERSGGSETPTANGRFIDRLTAGKTPEWLVKVPLPEELADAFWLYRIAGTNVEDG